MVTYIKTGGEQIFICYIHGTDLIKGGVYQTEGQPHDGRHYTATKIRQVHQQKV